VSTIPKTLKPSLKTTLELLRLGNARLGWPISLCTQCVSIFIRKTRLA
jgi:hypothetical protein